MNTVAAISRIRHVERGQALVEFAFTSSVFILALLAIVYCAQVGILSERVTIAARMAGTLNVGATPIQDESLSSAYFTLSAEAQTGSGTIFMGGQTAAIVNGKYVPACSIPAQSQAVLASTSPLWASATTPTYACDQTLVQIPSRVGTLVSEMFRHYTYRVSTTAKENDIIPAANLNAVEDYYAPPSVYALLSCDPQAGAAFSGSTRPPGSTQAADAVAPLTASELAGVASGMATADMTCGPVGVIGSTPVSVPPPAPIVADNACAGLIDVTCFAGTGAGDGPDPIITLNLDGVQIVSQQYAGNIANLVSSDSYANPVQTGYQVASNAAGQEPIQQITVQTGGSTFTLTANSDGSVLSDLSGAFLQNGQSYNGDAYITTDEYVSSAKVLSNRYIQDSKTPSIIYTNDGLSYSLLAPLSDIPVTLPNEKNIVGNALEIVTQNPKTNAVLEQFIAGYKIGNTVGLSEYFVGYNMDVGGVAAQQAASSGTGSALQNWDFNASTGYIQAKTVSGSI